MKRIVCALLAVIMMIGLVPTKAFAATKFNDVPEGSWYDEAVKWAVNNDITGGTGANNFSPDGVVTRAQMVTFLWKLANGTEKPEYKELALKFTDVKQNDYFVYAVGWAIKFGITAGTSPTTFSPKREITNKETIVFLYRAAHGTDCPIKGAKKAAGAGRLSNLNASGTFYEDACKWADAKLYLASVPAFVVTKNGTVTQEFTPDAKTTRATAVYLFWEMKTGKYNKYAVPAEKMVQTAEREYAKTTDNDPYNNPDWSDYSNSSDNWCSDFATWCANEVGLTNDNYPVIRTSYCPTLVNQFCKNENFFVYSKSYNAIINSFLNSYPDISLAKNITTNNFMPSRSDFVFFRNQQHPGAAHVGIVAKAERISEDVVVITVIEGNSGDAVKQHSYEVNVADGEILKVDGRKNVVSSQWVFDYISGFGRIR